MKFSTAQIFAGLSALALTAGVRAGNQTSVELGDPSAAPIAPTTLPCTEYGTGITVCASPENPIASQTLPDGLKALVAGDAGVQANSTDFPPYCHPDAYNDTKVCTDAGLPGAAGAVYKIGNNGTYSAFQGNLPDGLNLTALTGPWRAFFCNQETAESTPTNCTVVSDGYNATDNTPPPANASSPSHHGSDTGAIVGGVVGGLSLIAAGLGYRYRTAIKSMMTTRRDTTVLPRYTQRDLEDARERGRIDGVKRTLGIIGENATVDQNSPDFALSDVTSTVRDFDNDIPLKSLHKSFGTQAGTSVADDERTETYYASSSAPSDKPLIRGGQPAPNQSPVAYR